MAAPLQRPTRTTASTSTVLKTARGTHVFKIAGYSLHVKGLPAGKFVRSATFTVGGYDWCLRYYPGGYSKHYEGCPLPDTTDYVSVYVELRSKSCKVRALYDLRVANHATGQSLSVCTRPSSSRPFRNSFMAGPVDHVKGSSQFMKRNLLEAWPYLHDDYLTIECDLTVVDRTHLLTFVAIPPPEIEVPPSDLPGNLGKLLETKRGADVAFVVRGQVFHAHKLVLAMRSPVFDAELNGTMATGGGEDDPLKRRVTIENMYPAVFGALLHFMYTDSLPAMDNLVDERDRKEMMRHLLVAADRYAMDRMKLVCESILCKSLDAGSVEETLALAVLHRCSKLQVACVQFIKSSGRKDDRHVKIGCASAFAHIWKSI